jgi:RHS repeat-associated protein
LKVEFTLCSNTDVDRYQYAYDRDGNRLYKYNKVLTSLSELYTYDTLNQIASYKLGTLNGSKTDVTGSPTTSQSWDYDAVGNWDSITTNSTTQTRSANKQNEITAVSGATTPAYDSNGNLTTDEANYRFVYDAWNRVIQVKNSSNVVIVTYGRDALHRHVTDTVGSTVTDRFFSGDWQVLETKVGSNTVTRNVWSPVYVDGLVLRDRDTDANGTLDERLYSLQDANWNTTALVNAGGTVQERYTYTPFGQVTFRDGSGSTLSGSAKDWVFLHQGGERIAAGDYEFRNRVYSPSLGRWLSNDPLGFNAGDQNWYRSIGNNPGNGGDPSGLILPLIAVVGLGGSGLSGLGILGYDRWLKGPIELERDNLHYKTLESYARIDPEGKYRKTLNLSKPTTLGDLKDDLIPGYKDEVKIARENGGTILEIAQSGYGYAVGAGLAGRPGGLGGSRPPNLSPPNSGRNGAFNEAKRKSGIPTSQQPDRILPNQDRKGNLQPGRIYEFDVIIPGGGKKTIRIREDSKGHNFGPGDPQNRGPHFNDESGGHYDY